MSGSTMSASSAERAAPDASSRSASASALARALSSGRDLIREPAQIFDQHDAQRDRDGPQLADRQRLDALIGER